jgi:hypothetical protein
MWRHCLLRLLATGAEGVPTYVQTCRRAAQQPIASTRRPEPPLSVQFRIWITKQRWTLGWATNPHNRIFFMIA